MMLKIILCGLLVAVNGAPQVRRGFDLFREQEALWREFENNFDKFENKMHHFLDNIEKVDITDRVEGDTYVISMVIAGLAESEISVKRGGRQLVVEGHSADGSVILYSSRMLPPYVGESGNWTYENDVLKIVFPILHQPQSPPAKTRPVFVNEKKPNVKHDQGAAAGTGANNTAPENELPQMKEKQSINLDSDVEMVQV
ncbi:uncharacterized protein LOC119838847 [Zerene cesonia]|uniref:uncharacterized protein LOC119838847 n=1 Tax=Zerene cesonia TaxID=33412 RepID=UPI0018E553EE|nr:uncharacterized protein LOC119838847 [Zerene cesonia]